jgi:apolipoprotein N-acyltransferase
MRKVCFAFTFLSAVLLPLSLPNDLFIYGNPVLSVICLAPLFAALILAPSFRFASLLGIIFGGLSTFLVHYWLLFYGEYSFWTVSGVTLGYMGYHALLCPILYGLARVKSYYRVFLFAACWAFYEYLKSSGFLGFPWGVIPHSVNTVLPLVQLVDITGIWGLSFVLALANAFFAEILLYYFPQARRQGRVIFRHLLFVLSITILTLAYGTFALWREIPKIGRVRVLLVQHNEDPWSTGRAEDAILMAQALTLSALGQGSHPDIVVWSETAIRYYLREERLDRTIRRVPQKRPLHGFINRINTYFLVGAPFRPVGKSQFFNASLLFSPEGKLLQFYGKQHLVPLAETIPFWSLGVVKYFFGEILGLTEGWGVGKDHTVFEVPLKRGRSLKFGTPICFEDSYPDLCRRFILKGADAWINLTNVSWSRRESAEIQMLVAARFRAIENRRIMIRCTNGGVTSIIGPRGEVIGALDLFTKDTLAADVPVYRTTSLTPYTVFGDYFPLILAVILLLVLVVEYIKSVLHSKVYEESDLSLPAVRRIVRNG